MTHSVTWNKDKSVLTYKDDDGVWSREVFNKNLNLIKRTRLGVSGLSTSTCRRVRPRTEFLQYGKVMARIRRLNTMKWVD